MIVDSHHHLWKYSKAQYGWIGGGMPQLQHDFLLPQLEATMRAAGVGGTVAVQARQTLQETRWLLELATKGSLIRGVVGWAPLTRKPDLSQMASNKFLRGLRHVIHDEADDHYILRRDFSEGVALLQQFNLVYDILIFAKHLPQTIQFVDRHPKQIFVLDHIAKPKIREHQMEPWRTNIRKLAERRNVYCKLSGLVTEAAWKNWTPSDLAPYIDVVLEAFTPQRLMYGSDWPVMLLASDYKRWLGIVSKTESDRILSGTAIEAYRL